MDKPDARLFGYRKLTNAAKRNDGFLEGVARDLLRGGIEFAFVRESGGAFSVWRTKRGMKL